MPKLRASKTTEIKELNLTNENLHTQQLYAESYSRRENLKLFGIEERETRANSKDSKKVDTRDILIDFFLKWPRSGQPR